MEFRGPPRDPIELCTILLESRPLASLAARWPRWPLAGFAGRSLALLAARWALAGLAGRLLAARCPCFAGRLLALLASFARIRLDLWEVHGISLRFLGILGNSMEPHAIL